MEDILTRGIQLGDEIMTVAHAERDEEALLSIAVAPGVLHVWLPGCGGGDVTYAKKHFSRMLCDRVVGVVLTERGHALVLQLNFTKTECVGAFGSELLKRAMVIVCCYFCLYH